MPAYHPELVAQTPTAAWPPTMAGLPLTIRSNQSRFSSNSKFIVRRFLVCSRLPASPRGFLRRVAVDTENKSRQFTIAASQWLSKPKNPDRSRFPANRTLCGGSNNGYCFRLSKGQLQANLRNLLLDLPGGTPRTEHVGVKPALRVRRVRSNTQETGIRGAELCYCAGVFRSFPAPASPPPG